MSKNIKNFEKMSLKKFDIKDIVHNATILLLGRRRTGKCFGENVNVLMFDGSIKNVKDIKNDDILMGDNSTPRYVTNICTGIDTMYKIIQESSEYTVNSKHILSLKYTYDKKIINSKVSWFDNKSIKYRSKTFKNTTDAEIFYKNIIDDTFVDIPIEKYLSLSTIYKNQLKGYKVSVDFPQKQLPIEPYIFGYWLITGKIPEMNNKIINLNETNSNLIVHLDKNNPLVPDIYKFNSKENRKQLLLGFIKGIGKKSTPFENLINDIKFICESLGIQVKKIKRNLNWYLEIISTPTLSTPTITTQKIQIQVLNKDKYYGFEVNGNHRFVLDNFIVTHNSFLVRDIFYHHQKIPRGIIFSGTEAANPFFGDFFPDTFIHSEYNPQIIETAMAMNAKRVREARQYYPELNGLLPKNRFCIVLDDMLADASAWKKEKTIQEIFFNGRHFNIFFILTMQYPLGIPPALRSNIDYVFIFNEPSIKNRKKIYEDYAGIIPTFDIFQNILDECTKNYECVVIKLSGDSENIRDQVFWYKAKPHTDFRMGHKQIWDYHYKQYNNKYTTEEDNEKLEFDRLQQKYSTSKKLKVIVNKESDDILDAYEESY